MSTPDDAERLSPLAQRWPRASKFLLSGCAATVAELATFPLDLTKTRLQIQGEAALARLGGGAAESAPYRGMVRTALGIVQEEGFLKLWQGVTPAIYRHIVYSGGRMVTYEHLREVVFGKSEDKHYPLWKSVIGGMMAGVVGQFLANPTDLVKVQMQMEGKRKLEGKPLRFRGVHHAFAKILAEGGIRGLWAGWVPNIQRAALVNMGDLTTYDTVKHYLVLNTPLEDNIVTHGLSSSLMNEFIIDFKLKEHHYEEYYWTRFSISFFPNIKSPFFKIWKLLHTTFQFHLFVSTVYVLDW
ncbi:hypothetical protein JEQ12_010416 [Ovis aries]|uniref:Mitochondrial uncoupling protein 4 n=1 Tax=Ovis aries TaxID=9940 RepID=A0A836CS38_SHEEP|nr:hypothetical protein JEQ12_010416 [Ovis aries]